MHYSKVDNAVKLSDILSTYYFPFLFNVALFFGELRYVPHKNLILSEIIFSDFVLKNNIFFRISNKLKQKEVKYSKNMNKLVDTLENISKDQLIESLKNEEKKKVKEADKRTVLLEKSPGDEYIDSLLYSFVTLDGTVYHELDSAICIDKYSHNVLVLEFDNEHKVLIHKNADHIQFYLFENSGCFLSHIYISASAGKLANFFKTKNAQKGIGKKFFNWVIDFVRGNICDCFETHSCAKLFHLAFITLCTNKFLNKTALEIYRDFKITKEEDYDNGEIELTLQLKG